MLQKEKVAIARIFADIVKADRIIDAGEMRCWRGLCEKYDIDNTIRVKAREVSFAEALTVICSSNMKGIRDDLLGDCKAMTLSDGYCAQSEALLMIALIALLDPSKGFKGEVISVPLSTFNIDIATVLYIENGYDEEVNGIIGDNYRIIFKELQLAGFHFIYIPRIIDHYRSTSPELFKDILSFLAPAMSDENIDKNFRALMNMTTGEFCKDLLCNKCGITELRNTKPSLLIKIGNSYVGEDQYANYLKLEVAEDMVTTIQQLADLYTDMMSSDTLVVNTSEERDSQFHFHGFYKQLLDIFLVARDKRSSILLNPYKQELFFPELDAIPAGLHRKERALYALMLCQGKEGLNFKSPRTAAGMKEYKERMKRIQERYAVIYEMFGGEKDKTPDLGIDSIRRPIFSCLKGSIKKLKGLYNPDDYNITKEKDDTFTVHVDPSLVFVRELGEEAAVPLRASKLYRRCMEI